MTEIQTLEGQKKMSPHQRGPHYKKQAMKAIARKCQSNVFIMSFWGNCYFLNGKIVLCKANNRLKFQFDNLNIVIWDSIIQKDQKRGKKVDIQKKKHQNQQLHSYRKCQLKLHFLKTFNFFNPFVTCHRVTFMYNSMKA